MNIHKNARLTLARRIELVQMIVDQGLTKAAAAREAGVTEPTVRKWLGRYLVEGRPGLVDHSSRPKRSPRAISPHKALAIVELRRGVQDLGILGGMLPSNGEAIQGHFGNKIYWPLFEEAEKLGC